MAEMLNLFLQLASTVGTPVTLTGVDTEHDLKIACAAEPAEVQGDFAGTALSAGQALEFFTSMEGLVRLRPIQRCSRAGSVGSPRLIQCIQAFPAPPAVGVVRITASPASSTVWSQAFSVSMLPSRRLTSVFPT